MKNLIKTYFSKRFLPRWLVFIYDLIIVAATFVFAYLLRFNFEISKPVFYKSLGQLALALPLFTVIYYLLKPYSGIIRHSTTKDASLIFFSQAVGFAGLVIISLVARSANVDFLVAPISVLCIFFVLSTFILTGSRIFIKNIYLQLTNGKKGKINIMIFGAGELGQFTRESIEKANHINANLIGFIDDNKNLVHKRNAGTPIYSPQEAFSSVIPKFNVTEIIIAIGKGRITQERKRTVIEECMKQRLTIKEIPPVESWINGELNVRQIKNIRIEDLLGRESIRLDIGKIQEELKDKTILVTGAAGSIGSEIVRQLMLFETKMVILLDQAESPVFHIQHELEEYTSKSGFETVIADITDTYRMHQVFEKFRPGMVFHAAAYKHVPLMEANPYEAIRVNVGGTRILADLSIGYGVDKFVMVSTDKAVNPTSIMGASKRLCEIYIQSLAQQKGITAKFTTTRFGNVLGSNGSVVPLFESQIKKGGPLTVTHKDIKRYFMTIPEACQLVLEASAISAGGEIFIFDMGKPVRIYELAKKMVSLSGLEPHKDIEIKVTGLRPGEKL